MPIIDLGFSNGHPIATALLGGVGPREEALRATELEPQQKRSLSS